MTTRQDLVTAFQEDNWMYAAELISGSIPDYEGLGAPTAAFGAQAVSAAIGAGSDDLSGVATYVAPAAVNAVGIIAVVTFSEALPNAPLGVLLTAQNAASAAEGLYVSASSTTGFTISASVAPTVSAAGSVAYRVLT